MPDADTMPKAGDAAPGFNLPSHQGGTRALKDLRGQHVVLYFYPKDDTPGCTIEAQEFEAAAAQFAAKNTVVLGISPDDIDSHCEFAGKFSLNFQLLSDEDHAVAERYGVWVEKNMYGKKYMGVQRATFLIGADVKIVKVWPKVKPEGHAADVLQAVP